MKTRRIITALTSILAAACMMTGQFSAFSVNAQEETSVEFVTDEITEEIENYDFTHAFVVNKLSEYDEDAIVCTNPLFPDDITSAYVIRTDGIIDELVESTYLIFYVDSVSDESFLEIKNMIFNEIKDSLPDIGMPLPENGLSLGSLGCPKNDGKVAYIFHGLNNEQIYKVSQKAKEFENINKIEVANCFEHSSNCRVADIYFNSEKTAEEIISEYPGINLELNTEVSKYLNHELEPLFYKVYDYYEEHFNYLFDVYKYTDEQSSELKRIIENEDVHVEFNSSYADTISVERKFTTLYEKEPADLTYADAVKGTEEIIYGDADGNGEVELTDLTRISMAVMGDITLEGTEILAADVNGDGEVDITDVALMKQYVMGEAVKLGVQ